MPRQNCVRRLQPATAVEQQFPTSKVGKPAVEQITVISSDTSLAMGQSTQGVAKLAEQATELRSLITQMRATG